MTIEIRRWDEATDRVEDLTQLLHAAYAEWKVAGLRFTATYQDDALTRERLQDGVAWVAVAEDRLVGTIAVYQGSPDHDVPYYRRPGLWYFGQFGVLPGLKGQGVGRRLLSVATEFALAEGATELACDTSEQADRLVELYARWGFAEVDRFQWGSTNYVSLVLARPLP